MYLPHNEWVLHAYAGKGEPEKTQAAFWKLDVPEYVPSESTEFQGSLVKQLVLDGKPPAPIFKVRTPNRAGMQTYSVIVGLSVAESILRRRYFGVDLLPVG